MNRDQADTLEQDFDSYQKIARRACEPSGQEPSDGARWLRFAAAAGASLAGATSADAAINWVVPPNPIRVDFGENNSTEINLDGIGGNDLRIGMSASLKTLYTSPYFGYQVLGSALGIGNLKLIGGADMGVFGNVGVRRFASNTPIPAVTPATAGAFLHISQTTMLGYQNPITSNGEFGINDTGFAGFVNIVNGSPHAGWIKIQTDPFVLHGEQRLFAIEIVEWAYQTVPGVSIEAGQTSSVSIPGDYNGNGSVGPEDYTKWKSDFGKSVVAGTGADGNENAKVDAADYTVWRDNVGASGGATLTSAVPEPSTVSLGVLALGAAGVMALRRK